MTVVSNFILIVRVVGNAMSDLEIFMSGIVQNMPDIVFHMCGLRNCGVEMMFSVYLFVSL
jgi:hypothetical protein